MTTKPRNKPSKVALKGRAKCALSLAVVEGGEPPKEFKLFSKGWNETSKGNLLFDSEAAKAVVEAYKEKGIPRLPGDWEHASLQDPAKLADGGAPASCWFALEVRDGDLWAVNVKWTEKAAAQLRAGEYAHFSPAVEYDAESKRILSVINIALTNLPATYRQEKLVAASDRTPEVSSMDKIKEAMAALAAAFEKGDEEALKEACKALADALSQEGYGPEPKSEEMSEGEGEDKPEGEKAEMADAEGEEEKKELRALTGTKGKAAIAKLNAWKDAAAQVEALSARLSKLEGEKAATDFEAVIVAGKRDGKLSPAMLSDVTKGAGKYIASCRKSNDVAALSAYVEALPKIVNTEETPAPKSGVVALSDMEIEVAKKLGVDPEKLKASKAGK